MTNAFDIPKNSTLGDQLNKAHQGSVSASKYVKRKREQGIEPLRIDLRNSSNLNPRLFASPDGLRRKIKQG